MQSHAPDTQELLTFAMELARNAGEILRTHARHARSSVETKSSSVDIVTDADHASEAYLVETIRSRRPDDGIIGEEGTRIASSSGVEWIIDPLDGTTNFVYSIPSYAVSVGATFAGAPIVGAVYNPILDELYTASAGGGSWLNIERRLATNRIDNLALALIATGFNYDSAERFRQGGVIQQLLPDIRDIRRAGSAALDLCNVASGRVDAYFETGVKAWDFTAGWLIAHEAGAVVTAMDGTNKPTGDILAAPARIHEQLVPYLNK